MPSSKLPDYTSSTENLLAEWLSSTSYMHHAHHDSAVWYERNQQFVGLLVAGLSTLAAGYFFLSFPASEDMLSILFNWLISTAPIAMSGLGIFLYLGWKVERHYQAVRYFQAVRRLVEEEIMWYRSEKRVPGLEEIRKQWTEALRNSTPIPSNIRKKI